MAEGASAAPGIPGSKPGVTEASEEALLTFVKQSDGPAQRHQALLGKLKAVQMELQGAFKGVAGDAVNGSFSETIRAGESVARYHEQIVQGIVNASSQFAQQDADAMSQVMSRMNADLGSFGGGSVDGEVSSSNAATTLIANPKVDTNF
ncbi:WXG100 family type VII secretion target [Nocardia carnea]|uniref:WXG100 family type VII secretion target n=1 Tax=Nocardia carnea TaxID=37328 RepID=UPI00245594B8|nr:hypothetical protein [Nocardia carnea]